MIMLSFFLLQDLKDSHTPLLQTHTYIATHTPSPVKSKSVGGHVFSFLDFNLVLVTMNKWRLKIDA